MPEVDTSIYNNTAKPTDMMGTLSGVAGIQNQMNQNKLFQQQYNTNRAVSEGIKASIDPTTGQVDQDKLRQWIARDPNAGYGLQQVIQGSQEAQQRGQTIESSQINLARQHMQTAESYLSPLLAHPNPSSSEIVAALGEAMTKGHLNEDVARNLYSSLPRGPDGQIDETKIRPWLQQQQLRMLDQKQRFDAMFPAPVTVNTGQDIVPIRMPQIGDITQAGPPIQIQPSPTTIQYDANGQAHFVGTMGNQGVQPAPGQPGQGVGMGGGVQGPQATPGQVSQGGGMGRAGQVGLPPGTLAAAPPGVTEAAVVDANRSAGAWANLRDQTADASTQIFQLGKAMEGIKGANTGPGSDALNNAKSFLMTIDPGILKGLGLTDPAGVKNYDEANKYLMANALSASGSLGEGTDSKIASAITANASTHISNLAAQDVIKANIALVKAKQAQALAFQQSGLPPGKFSDWAVQWSKNNDPRAFLADQQSAKERRAMMDKMNAREMAAYVSSFKFAAKNGVINLLDLPK